MDEWKGSCLERVWLSLLSSSESESDARDWSIVIRPTGDFLLKVSSNNWKKFVCAPLLVPGLGCPSIGIEMNRPVLGSLPLVLLAGFPTVLLAFKGFCVIRTLDSEVERSTFKSGEFSFVKSVVDLNLAVLMNFGFRDISLSNSSVSESSRFDADLGLGLSDIQNISKVIYFQSPFIFAKYYL